MGVVLGVLAILTVLVSFGFAFFASGPLAVVALLLGFSGRRRVERGETREGRGAANAALILGIAGIVLTIVGFLVAALLIAGYWES